MSSVLKNNFLKKTVLKERLGLLHERKQLYKNVTDVRQKTSLQLEYFNRVWRHCFQFIPFYQNWKSINHLPERISSIGQLKEFPLLTKEIIQNHQDLIFQNGKIKNAISTGGSTGQPTRFPSLSQDAFHTYADIYLGRSWWGIEPLDSALLFWGHSHLFGSGIKGIFKNYKRKWVDSFLNMKRLNAYDMTVQTIEKYYQIYHDTNPHFILGYTSCLYKLVKYIDEHKLMSGKKNNLKAVILTSETVVPSEVELMRRVFCVPIVIEYGMAETGAIGYSYEDTWNIHIFWDAFLAMEGSNHTMVVSTLSNRGFPLIHYDTEDKIQVKESYDESVLSVSAVMGRQKDILKIGTVDESFIEVSGILFIHILKSLSHIFSIQFKQINSNTVKIFLVGNCELNLVSIKNYFMEEIRKDHPHVNEVCLQFEQVWTESKTLAGKERIMVISKS